MRVLLIKTSSMGDLIHTFPALTDAGKILPNIKFDWLVEESFAEIPSWHPLVDKVIPIAIRRWRRQLFSKKTYAEIRQLRRVLNQSKYDFILDAQGLVKTAWLNFLVKGKRVGLDWSSAREALASLIYQEKHTINFYQHAVKRMRELFSQALHYPLPDTFPDFGFTEKLPTLNHKKNEIIFLHSTTWESKQWPEIYWIELARLFQQAGFTMKMGGGNTNELARAARIAQTCDAITLLPRLSINATAELLSNARGVIAVDTGFGHLAAALTIPTVSIYGSTNPNYTSALGKKSIHLAANFPCSPCLQKCCDYKKPTAVAPACYTTITPKQVFNALMNILEN